MPSGCSQDLLERFICTLLWRTQPDARSDGIFSVAKLENWLSSWPEVSAAWELLHCKFWPFFPPACLPVDSIDQCVCCNVAIQRKCGVQC